MNDLKIPMPLPLVDLEAVLAEAKLHWPRKQLPPLTGREADALESGAKIIPLTRGKWAIVDAATYPLVSGRTWHTNTSPSKVQYAGTRVKRIQRGVSTPIALMHKEIFQTTELHVDHRNLDGLDNRMHNLRAATHAQNMANKPLMTTNKTGFKGVSWCKRDKRFLASIKINGRSMGLGNFHRAEDAAAAYSVAATKFHGQYTRLK